MIANRLNWIGELLQLVSDVDEYDRTTEKWVRKRSIYYNEIGITSQEQYLAKQADTEVVMRIVVRWDKSITQKESRIRIDQTDFKITRIYTTRDKGEMELSLAYVD